MPKRPSLKGKGADIFLSHEEPSGLSASTARSRVPQNQVQGKATFYLPGGLLELLDEIWLKLRARNRRLKKSEIVRVALESALDDYKEKAGDSALGKRLLP